MATYSYICDCGNAAEHQYPIGEALRKKRCDECGGTLRLRIGAGVNISATALATKGTAVHATALREKRWEKDGDAYQRMRRKGMQPEHIDGSATLENEVGSQRDIKYRKVWDRVKGEPGVTADNFQERVTEGEERAREVLEDQGATWPGQSVPV